MTKLRRPFVTIGASSMMVGAGVILAVALASFVGPQASQAVDTVPTPVGIDVIVPVIEVPPEPTVGAVIPVGAAADSAQVEVVVSGLQPYSYYELYLRSAPVLVASGFADSTGTFKVTITLPMTLEAGTHSLEVKATDAGGQPYTKTVSQFSITTDRRLAGAGPGSSLVPPTSSTATSTNPDGSTNSSIQKTQTDPNAAAGALGSDPLNVGGILLVSGVTVSTQPSLSPQGGTVTLSMTVKNVSHTTFDSSMDFWLTSPLTDTLARIDQINVAGLSSGETRTIEATLTHVGHWPVMVANAIIRPPASVEKTELAPQTREAFLWMWPLFGLVMLALFVAGFLLWRYLPLVGRVGRAKRAVERDNIETLADAAAIVRAEAEIVSAQVALITQPIIVAEAERPPAPAPTAPASVPTAELIAEPTAMSAAAVVPKKPRAPRAPKPVVEGEAIVPRTPAVKKPAVKKPAVEADATTPKKPRAPRASKIGSAPEKPATETSAPESVEGDA